MKPGNNEQLATSNYQLIHDNIIKSKLSYFHACSTARHNSQYNNITYNIIVNIII